jgi:hypothetical protein
VQSRLITGAHVGTVDKFHGQEAEIVLICRVASSCDNLRRQIAFLYTQIRLILAISRARGMAAATTRLLETPRSTLGQLKLVNTLRRVNDFPDALRRRPSHGATRRES